MSDDIHDRTARQLLYTKNGALRSPDAGPHDSDSFDRCRRVTEILRREYGKEINRLKDSVDYYHAENVKSVDKLFDTQERLKQLAISNPEFKSFVDKTIRKMVE